MADIDPTQAEIDGVAAVFEKLRDDLIGRQSSFITAKMLKRVFQPGVTAEELNVLVTAYFDDDRPRGDFYGRVGSGLIAAISKAEELGIVTIKRRLPQ